MTASVDIDPSDWRAVTDDLSWLKTELVVNGISVHLDAVEVIGRGVVQEIRGELGDALAGLHEALGADGPWKPSKSADATTCSPLRRSPEHQNQID